jgi:hypothetical protein
MYSLSEQTVGIAVAADVQRDPRPLGRACFISRRTNEARTSLNHLGLYVNRQLLADVWSPTVFH